MKNYVLEMKGVHKYFGGVKALQGVNLNLGKGEVLCLLGENGAGKSTLMKILAGVLKPTEGEIFIDGNKVKLEGPQDAYNNGISIVHQELVQIPYLSVAENIFCGRYPMKGLQVDKKKMREETKKLMESLGIYYDPDSLIVQHSVAHRQMIEIMKAISREAKIIIFDEPTAVLTVDECEFLFDIIRKLKAEGRSVIFISHRMSDIATIGDRVLVLRDGLVSGGGDITELTTDDMIRLMVGRELNQIYPQKINVVGEVVLEMKHIRNERLKDISIDLKHGEILGIGGLVGAGRTELLNTIMGIDEYEGEILYNGMPIKNRDPYEAVKNSFSKLPEDRKDQGLVLMHSIQRNIELSILGKLSKFGVMNLKKERETAEKYKEQLRIRTPNIDVLAQALSGGNQQKVVIAKCLATDPKVLLLDEPTRGVDVGAKSEIYEIINNLASNGVSIIMVSSELPELLGVCDRIAVMHEGHMNGVIDAKEATEEIIMHMAVNKEEQS